MLEDRRAIGQFSARRLVEEVERGTPTSVADEGSAAPSSTEGQRQAGSLEAAGRRRRKFA
jgi:hypothetical protein